MTSLSQHDRPVNCLARDESSTLTAQIQQNYWHKPVQYSLTTRHPSNVLLTAWQGGDGAAAGVPGAGGGPDLPLPHPAAPLHPGSPVAGDPHGGPARQSQGLQPEVLAVSPDTGGRRAVPVPHCRAPVPPGYGDAEPAHGRLSAPAQHRQNAICAPCFTSLSMPTTKPPQSELHMVDLSGSRCSHYLECRPWFWLLLEIFSDER